MLKASYILDKDYQIGKIDKRIYGSFLEHLGRVIYGGIYQPGHPEADEEGFRQDVLRLVKELGVSIVRYPGGNFVSGFDWEDSIGPKDQRPRRADLAWGVIEDNQFGLHEFCDWVEKAGADAMYAVNLGTRTPMDARNLVEYANFPEGTKYSDMRIRNGRKQPFNIRTWCLGNELDGVWQMGQTTPQEYGRRAREAANLMKRIDKNIEVTACGSSSSWMPTVGSWELGLLDVCYDNVDYVSIHRYYEKKNDSTEDYLAEVRDMDDFIDTIVSVCDAVKGKKRSSKRMMISFDEWNVGYHSRKQDAIIRSDPKNDWGHALPIMQDEYTMEDALFVGEMLMSLIRHADRVKIACLAQLVNAIAPIMTSDSGCWKQTTYYPFLHASRFGRGISLLGKAESPFYQSISHADVPSVDTAAVLDEDGCVTVFAVNRREKESVDFSIDLRSFGRMEAEKHIVLGGGDPLAVNIETDPSKVKPHETYDLVQEDEIFHAELKPLTWNVIRFRICDAVNRQG